MQHLLVALECRDTVWPAVVEALSCVTGEGACLTFVFVPPRVPVPVIDMQPGLALDSAPLDDAIRQRGARLLQEALAAAKNAGVPASARTVDGLDPARSIVDMAQALGCDGIVVSCEPGTAFMRLVGGHLVPALVTASPLPVLIAHDRAVRRQPRRWRRARLARRVAAAAPRRPAPGGPTSLT